MRTPVVLVVDGFSPVRDVLARLLTVAGWDVVGAATVADGLVRLQSLPDCVILDLELPDGVGEHLLASLGTDPRRPGVVILTALEEPARHRAIRERFQPVAILLKPVDFRTLLQACDAFRQGYFQNASESDVHSVV